MKRIFAVLLALVLVANLPATAFAENIDNDIPPVPAAETIPAAGNYVCWADSPQQAQEIADEIGAALVCYENKIATLYREAVVFSAEENSQPYTYTEGEKEITVYPNYIYTVETDTETGEDTEETASVQWHREYLQLDQAWQISTGQGIKVAVIDSGIDTDHPALTGNTLLAETVIPDSAYNNGTFLLAYKGPGDVLGHGTHVAGIIAANTEDKTVMGVAPDCKIISVKALEKNGSTGYGYTSWIANAILKAVEQGADIINLSVGGSKSRDGFLTQAIDIAVESGAIVVCAAGNKTGLSSREGIFYPALYEKTLAVTAAKQTEEGAEFDDSYSRYGDGTDFIAPGTDIYSTVIDDFGYKKGTSMACPVVSGTAALVLSALGETENADAVDILKNTALDMGEEGVDIYHGYGMIQPLAAVQKAESLKPTPTPTPEVTSSPEPTETPRPIESPEPSATPAPSPKPTKKPVTEKPAPQPVQPPRPITTPAPEKTPQPAEPQLEQKIEDLKEQLETLPPEEEQVYTTQEETPQTDSSTPEPAHTGLIILCIPAVIISWLILILKRRKEK